MRSHIVACGTANIKERHVESIRFVGAIEKQNIEVLFEQLDALRMSKKETGDAVGVAFRDVDA